MIKILKQCLTNNISLVLYKYRDWDKDFHKSLLLKNEIFLSPPSDFNDPFDCKIPTNYLSMKKKEVKPFVDKMTNKSTDYLLKNGKNIEVERQKLENRLSNRILFQKESDDIEFGWYDKCTGIYSLSFRWDSILMWSHYSNCHKGFCVGFNIEKILASNLFGRGDIVKYKPIMPVIKPNPVKTEQDKIDESWTKTFTKAKEWEYEKEYRLVKSDSASFTSEKRKIQIEDTSFAELLLGIYISKNHRETLMKIAKEKNIPVFQTHTVPFKFKMDRVQIQ